MKCSIAALLSFLTLFSAVAANEGVLELRTYYAAPGKLDDLQARFRNHTLKLFEKHGMKNVGYWVPVDNPENKLIYLLAYPSRDAARQSWKAFSADPEWHEIVKRTEMNGRLVRNAKSVYLAPTDYSAPLQITKADPPRMFELRTYKATPGKLADLNARFRDHTVRLFKKHGMQQIGYWIPLDKDKGAEDTLIYLLAHRSREAADESFKAFRADPAWISARKASEEKAGGSLTVSVDPEFLRPVDYSPMQ